VQAAWRNRATFLLAALAMTVVPLGTLGQAPEPWPPEHLRDTGLYANWASKTIAGAHLPFSPQYPLWTDGASKRRWMHLPTGTWIDASNPDEWEFPVGTRVWKEFRFARRAETRLIERTADGWQYATYAWNEDETEAPLAPARGISRSVDIRPGVRHAIPSRADCRACHEASPVRLLGFGALQLSSDRDPNALHAEPVPDGGVDLTALVARGLVRNLPARLVASPPRIEASSATARAALGYLHANCGSCHIGSGEMAALAFALNYPLERPEGTEAPALLTSVGRASTFRSAGDAAGERVSPGDPDGSVLLTRMASRHPLLQMPPLGSRIIDEAAVQLVRRWIAEQVPAQAPIARSTHQSEETR
jgi:mono/diheme cytochrome c family protein